MQGAIIAFVVYCVICISFAGVGVACFFQKKPLPIWSFDDKITVNDVKKYNRAVGTLWIVFAILLFFLGLPLLNGQNDASIVLLILGTLFLSIGFMVVYNQIEKKYRIR